MKRQVKVDLELLQDCLYRLEQLGSEDNAQGEREPGWDVVTNRLRAVISNMKSTEPPISRCAVCDEWCIGKVCRTCKNKLYLLFRGSVVGYRQRGRA